MKLLVVLSIVLLGTYALDKEYFDKIMKEVEQVGQNCGKEEHATDSDMSELLSYTFPPSTHEAKCVLACFYQHYKMMKDDGSFDKETAIKVFDEIKQLDGELHAKIMKIIDTCDSKKQSFDDRCEAASAMAACVKIEADAMKEDGTINKAGAMVALRPLQKADPQLYQKILKIFITCGMRAKLKPDPCDTATDLAACAKDEAQAMGLDESLLA
ncbi:PBP GOBP domain containing protein [Asbolus verrucosus]|uniref:PBP GOBP domain containing protein n=1 Tax=Asbolus verrucosus TaxID=1661398 RepID=A0A482W066_ASBVE|nr:PBP GOBP domain containing protein [Asbolus verrucosus]